MDDKLLNALGEFYNLIDKDKVFVSTKTGEHITGPEKLFEIIEKYDKELAITLILADDLIVELLELVSTPELRDNLLAALKYQTIK